MIVEFIGLEEDLRVELFRDRIRSLMPLIEVKRGNVGGKTKVVVDANLDWFEGPDEMEQVLFLFFAETGTEVFIPNLNYRKIF